MFDNALAGLAVVAAFVVKVISLIKPVYEKSEYQKYIDTGLSLALSAGLCLAWGVDLFPSAGIDFGQYAWIGPVFTGIVAGLGSNVLHDVIKLLEMWKAQKKFDLYFKAAVSENLERGS